MKKKIALLMIIITGIFTNSCTDIDDKLAPITATGELIEKDSELYSLINRMTTQGVDPMEQIACIDFVYPMALIIYDASQQATDTVTLWGDGQFSELLGELPEGYSISISYPITTTLDDGTTVSVTNNAELKASIDSCANEDIIIYLEHLFCGDPTCYWTQEYTPNGSNDFAGGVFKVNTDGTVTFMYNSETYNGTWAFLFADGEYQINIFLEGNSPASQYWHFSLPVTTEGEVITIAGPDGDITLAKSCETFAPFAIGQAGPAGGIVFFDKGVYTEGWRYMEAMPQDLAQAQWGCASAAIPSTGITTIGSGKKLSSGVASYHDNINYYYTNPQSCNSANDGSVAAKAALLQTGARWFLPSEEELALLYLNLHQAGLGNFSNTLYWSTTSDGVSNAKALNFSTGATEATSKTQTLKVRAVRYF